MTRPARLHGAPDPAERIRQQLFEPSYLGDGLYCAFDGYQIRLWASDGLRVTNEVWLEPEVLAGFEKWVGELRVKLGGRNDRFG